jgi:hypothetical protein
MAWSLMNHLAADDVTKMLKTARGSYNEDPTFEPAMPDSMAAGLIHAALWSNSSRAGSTASGYAFMNLMSILGIKRWSFADDWSDVWPKPAQAIVDAGNPAPPDGTP